MPDLREINRSIHVSILNGVKSKYDQKVSLLTQEFIAMRLRDQNSRVLELSQASHDYLLPEFI